MYQIIDANTDFLIEENLKPMWVKQQKRVDLPIGVNNLKDADGVVLSDNETYLGIEGRNMQNYTPLVRVVEVSDGPYVSGQIRTVQRQNDTNSDKLDAQQTLQLSGLQGQADQYTVALSTQEQVTAQQQLNLTALQGIADLYATLLTMQAALTPTTAPTTTPETEE